MKSVLLIVALLYIGHWNVYAQRPIRDKHIVNQQERMVFKQWSKNKFTPTSGFLGLNPEYLLTWVWYPNYPKKDLRPLSASGPQTQRLLLVAAMENIENASKLQADTLRNTALSEIVNYSGELSAIDPLWVIYYKNEFAPLLNNKDSQQLVGTEPKVRNYLISTGLLKWYNEEQNALIERLANVRTTTVDRGSRILAYHRMLYEYRKLQAMWENKKQRAKLYLSLLEANSTVRSLAVPLSSKSGRTDKQIAEEIVRNSKL